MELTTLLAIIIILIGVFFILTWFLGDRSFNWLFLASLITYALLGYTYFYRDWISSGVIAVFFLIFLHLYLYDLYFTHYKVKHRGRR